MADNDFHSLNLSPALLQVVDQLGFKTMTPVQARAIPLIMSGRDVIGQSRTGSGKTAAFALPILHKIDLGYQAVQALIISPTRELCAQVAREVRRFGSRYPGLQVVILAGGQPARPQKEALQRGAHIVVGTPGRIQDHIRRGSLDLSRISTVVLDEADRMLDMGFKDDMETILEETPSKRQTILFSATYPPQIQSMSSAFQRDPERVTVKDDSAAPEIRQVVYETDPSSKFDALISLLQSHRPESTLVFCNLKVSAAELEEKLIDAGIPAASLHGDLDQVDRDRVMAKFRNRSIPVLVATDVAARGLDVEKLDLVVNYELPPQAEVYVHRIGRTGRAGERGLAVSFASARDSFKRQRIEEYTGVKMETEKTRSLVPTTNVIAPLEAAMDTLYVSGGRKDKMRPGDILGALTGEAGGLNGSDIGKIEIHDKFSYVAVSKKVSKVAVERLRAGKIKGRKFKVELVR
jgi:ATP-independent RNA helicase DbpA